MALSLRTILVPYDGSEPARAAVTLARLLAANTGATVVLCYVLPGHGLLDDLGAGPAAARDATSMLEGVARAFPGPTRVRLLEGDPADAVAGEAQKAEADLVVLGARGRSPISSLLLGSTARKLLNATRRPVLVVHETVDAVRTVLAGVGLGEGAVVVAQAAAAVAAATSASVTLVNVVDAEPALVDHPERFGIPEHVWRSSLAKHAERVFGPARAAAAGAKELLRYGRPADEIRQAAEDLGADLVVVARRGRSGIDIDAWFSVAFTLAVRGPFATLVV